MATTYSLISSNVLSSSAASVTFSSIPSTYTDLVVRGATRIDAASPRDLDIRFNASSGGTDYSWLEVRGNGAAASSEYNNNADYTAGDFSNNLSTYTANSFSSFEFYIPNYRSAANKPASMFSAQETNATTAQILAVANLWRNTAAITQITFSVSANNLVAGSSFYLYGIKNS